MKTSLRSRRRGGFTLIELMIVVAIVAILALLAIFGVSKFLATAKTAEATNTIGQINKLAIQAYDRESGTAQLRVAGGISATPSHSLCGSSNPVPGGPASIQNRKYTPSPNGDYQKLVIGTNDNQKGWRCLRHEMTEPQYYRYAYTGTFGNPAVVAPQLGVPANMPAGPHWLAEAQGDLDGDGTFGRFVTGGASYSSGFSTTICVKATAVLAAEMDASARRAGGLPAFGGPLLFGGATVMVFSPVAQLALPRRETRDTLERGSAVLARTARNE